MLNRFLAAFCGVGIITAAAWLGTAGDQTAADTWNEIAPGVWRTAYLVVPTGFDALDCALDDGQTIDWHGWNLTVVGTPGHSRDHVAFAARKGAGQPLLLFCGDALCSPGKLWTPYTTDWDHWTD